MKNLKQYVRENLITESESKFVRFEPGKLKDAADTISSVISACNKAQIYNERTDNGVKFKFTPGNPDKYTTVQDIMQQYVSGLSDEDQAADSSAVKKIQSNLNSLAEYIDADAESDDDKSDEKKDDDKNKKDDDE
jgi:hypothetical protein